MNLEVNDLVNDFNKVRDEIKEKLKGKSVLPPEKAGSKRTLRLGAGFFMTENCLIYKVDCKNRGSDFNPQDAHLAYKKLGKEYSYTGSIIEATKQMKKFLKAIHGASK